MDKFFFIKFILYIDNNTSYIGKQKVSWSKLDWKVCWTIRETLCECAAPSSMESYIYIILCFAMRVTVNRMMCSCECICLCMIFCCFSSLSHIDILTFLHSSFAVWHLVCIFYRVAFRAWVWTRPGDGRLLHTGTQTCKMLIE